MITEHDIEAVLRRVPDMDAAKGDIVSAGRISGISIKAAGAGLHVTFAINVTSEEAKAAEGMRTAAEAAVDKLTGVLSVTAVLSAHKAAPEISKARPVVNRTLELPDIKHIIAVASGKGGVGKSTTAVNLAIALSQSGRRVGLLDADIYGPSIPRLMGLPSGGEDQKAVLRPHMQYGLTVMSIGFLVAEETPMIWRGPMVQSAIQQMLRDVPWGPLDILVVDMPPGTGDAQLTMAQQVPLAGAVIVSTPQDLALLDARKGIAMFERVHVPILGVVENMSSFLCPQCGTESHIFGHGGARAEAEKRAVPFLGEVPLDIRIRETSDAGQPITVREPAGPHAAIYKDMAKKMIRALEENAPPAAPRIVL